MIIQTRNLLREQTKTVNAIRSDLAVTSISFLNE